MKTPETNKPTGNLEELFRHHLAEASVPPRPHVWEQIDNSLLLAQNETYRRRLRGARWMAAASLLLATLAGTGWWLQHAFTPAPAASGRDRVAQPGRGSGRETTAADLARAQPAHQGTSAGSTGSISQSATASLNSPATPSASTPTSPATENESAAIAAKLATEPTQSASGIRPTVQPDADLLATKKPSQRAPLSGSIAESAERTALASRGAAVGRISREKDAAARAAGSFGAVRSGAAASRNDRSKYVAAAIAGAKPEQMLASTTAGRAAAAAAAQKAKRESATAQPTPEQGVAALASSGKPGSVLLLSAVAASIMQPPVAALPSPLATQPVLMAEIPTPAAPRNWHLGFTYAISAFQSNINFSKAGLDAPNGYKSVLGPSSAALSDMAAAEYQARQRPGLGQRLRLQASRRLRGNWSLATGFELAQQESHSTTSYRFMGDQIPDFNQSARTPQQRETHARYQLVGLPLEVVYADPVRTGFSLYGRLGGVANVLLTSRAEIDGSPEATRTYDLLSASTPYRRLLGSVRGAAGVQLRPVGHDYTLRLGPVVEGGIWSMNAHPAQDFIGQSRPYSFGMEAGVEFGRNSRKL